MALTANTELLIGQWSESPRINGILQSTIDRGNVFLEQMDEVDRMRHIDTAKGVWLDYLGARLGIRRPIARLPASDLRFGFTGPPQARPFDTAPFKGLRTHDGLFPLPDEVWRGFIKARGITVFANGSCEDYARAVNMVDPAAQVEDNRNMTVTVTTDEREVLELADDTGVFPRAAGVRVIYAAQSVFGFDTAGRPFDTAPFKKA